MAPMKNEYLDVPGDARRAALPQPFTGNAVGRLPARLRVRLAALQRLRGGPAPLGRRRSSSRTTGRSTDKLSLNLGLRYDFITPALEAENHQTNFDPAGTGSAGLRQRRLARGPRPREARTRTTSRRASASSTSSTTRRCCAAATGIFYNLFDRIGSEDQLALASRNVFDGIVPVSMQMPPDRSLLLDDGDPLAEFRSLNGGALARRPAPDTDESYSALCVIARLRGGSCLRWGAYITAL